MAKRKEEEYEEEDSEEYEEEEEENELPDVDDDDDSMTKDEQEAVRNLARVKAQGNDKAYRKLRMKTCKKFPDLALCRTEMYEWPFLPNK